MCIQTIYTLIAVIYSAVDMEGDGQKGALTDIPKQTSAYTRVHDVYRYAYLLKVIRK